jgi:hypothetical protein
MLKMNEELLKKWSDRQNTMVTHSEAVTLDFFDSGGEICRPGESPLKTPVSAESTALDVMAAFDTVNGIESEIQKRKIVSPDWETGSEMFLKELNGLLNNPEHVFINVEGNIQHLQRPATVAIQVYKDIMRGRNFTVLDYSYLLVWNEVFVPELLRDIANGAALAYIFPRLKAESEGKEYQEPKLFGPVRLKWEGQKNQLYNVLRQLKDKELISNSYNELADFLKNHVIPFHTTAKETIEKELKKKADLPKDRRINLDTSPET